MDQESNRGGKVVIIVIISVLVLAAMAGGYYLLIYKPEQEAKEKARLEQLAREEAERKRKEVEAQNKIKYDALIVQADSVFNQEDWETAQALYSEASGLVPGEQYPKDQLALITAKLDEIAARKAAGIVETISSPTGRYYVIVSSSVDGDLAMDYASKLAKEGVSVKVLKPPADSKVYHRVAVADYGSSEQAENAKVSFGTYGEGVWVLKY